jgi:hypothetical protein
MVGGRTDASQVRYGLRLAAEVLGYGCGLKWYWVPDIWGMPRMPGFAIAREAVRHGTPFVVSYDNHSALGLGTFEPQNRRDQGWVFVDPALGPPDTPPKWVGSWRTYGYWWAYDFVPWVEFVRLENPQEVEIHVGGTSSGDRLLRYTGTAVCMSRVGMTIPPGFGFAFEPDDILIRRSRRWMRGKLSFEVGRHLREGGYRGAVVAAALASIQNAGSAVNAGWAIDRAAVVRDVDSGRPRVSIDYAVRDTDGVLLRVSYSVSALVQPASATRRSSEWGQRG